MITITLTNLINVLTTHSKPQGLKNKAPEINGDYYSTITD